MNNQHHPPTPQTKRMAFANALMNLRAMCATVYDKGKIGGMKMEDIQKGLAPMRSALEKMIVTAAESDIEGCVTAIQFLESHIGANNKDIKYLMQKNIDAQEHIDHIKRKLIERMERDGLTELTQGGSIIALIDAGGKKTITTR